MKSIDAALYSLAFCAVAWGVYALIEAWASWKVNRDDDDDGDGGDAKSPTPDPADWWKRKR